MGLFFANNGIVFRQLGLHPPSSLFFLIYILFIAPIYFYIA